jgi:hypothetical protein
MVRLIDVLLTLTIDATASHVAGAQHGAEADFALHREVPVVGLGHVEVLRTGC